MQPIAISILTVCGIEELPAQSARKVSHVLSLLDPDLPELESFAAYNAHERVTLRFHDIITPQEGRVHPTEAHVAEILDFGASLRESAQKRQEGHLLVHCHMGISRSTAAMLSLMAQVHADEGEDALFARLRTIRPQAWPNSVMIGFADAQLKRGGRLSAALGRHYAHQLEAQPRYRQWMADLGRGAEVAMAG
ncbi:protein-tyrosine-phosphatase [Boseaceae bacterium BT-24-1]|nr:protein-tyrosine-phosphatase [Boseaceae bacterium BT-24-1]